MSSTDKRSLAAIMFIDIVGYSRMMALNEERTLEMLKDFERIGSSNIKENDGIIIKKIGDELFCEFSSAKHAVDGALAIQNTLQSYNDSRPKDFKLQVRIGIHIGDIVKRDNDVFGDGVNVASRISPFAAPGGICVSSAVKNAISSHPKYNIKSEGKQELKNIVEKHSLFRVETGFELLEKKGKDSNSNVKQLKKWIFRLFLISISIYLLWRAFVGLLILNDTYIKHPFKEDSYVGRINIDEINKKLKKIETKENLYISPVRSSSKDLELFNSEWTLNDVKHKLIPISESEIKLLNESIISNVLHTLDNRFNYNLHDDLIDNMVKSGKLPIEYDYRWQIQKKLSKNDVEYKENTINSYEGSTNQFQIESDIHYAIYLNVYKIEPPENQINSYVLIIIFSSFIGDILDDGDWYKNPNNPHINYNYLDTVHTKLYDIGIHQVAGGMSLPILMSSTEDMPGKLSLEINWKLQNLIDGGIIKGEASFQSEIIAINHDNIVFEYKDKDKRLKKNMTLQVIRQYVSGTKNGAEKFKNDLMQYKASVKENDSLMTIFQEGEDANYFSELALQSILDETHCVSRPNCSFTFDLETEIKVLEIFENTARGIIVKKNKDPYIKIQVGDELYFK